MDIKKTTTITIYFKSVLPVDKAKSAVSAAVSTVTAAPDVVTSTRPRRSPSKSPPKCKSLSVMYTCMWIWLAMCVSHFNACAWV